MTKPNELAEALQRDLKADFDNNMAALKKFNYDTLMSIAKGLGIRVMERKTHSIFPLNVSTGQTFTNDLKKEFINLLRMAPKDCTIGYNWQLNWEEPLFTTKEALYMAIKRHINEDLLRATSGRNKDFVSVLIRFNSVIEASIGLND